MIDKEYLQRKIEEYRNIWLDYMANANANHGAMLACQEMLDKLKQEEAEKVTDTPDKSESIAFAGPPVD